MNVVEGRVVRTDAKVCHVALEPGSPPIQAALRGSLFEDLQGMKNPVAVGDLVKVDVSSEPAALLEILPRRNRLGRIASAHDPREQVLVANVDQLLVIGSLSKPGFSSARTDRILAACADYSIPSVLVINKIDLAEEDEVEEIAATYEQIPIPVLRTCAVDGRGIDELRALLQDKVSVLYGASGAGKSTLVNYLQPGLNIKEGKISKYWSAGKHTTSYSQLHPLDFGGWVIDTPGIRAFRLHGVPIERLRDLFGEFGRYQGKCRFPTCTHDHEPGCAVWDAVDRLELPASRYASYIDLLIEADPARAVEGDEFESPDEEP